MGKERRGIHLIAEMANVSIGTVDRALHGRGGIKDATRQRILQIARQIGYTPNLAARALSVTKSISRIGVCMPREIHFFYDQLWGGIADEAKRCEQLGIRFTYRPVPGLGQLSTRERELVTLVAQGDTDAQIAAQLSISVRAVAHTWTRSGTKTGCRRRAGLTRLALTAGLV